MSVIGSTELVAVLERLREQAVGSRNRLRAHYVSLPVSDPRVVTARHLKAVVASGYLAAIFADESLAEPQWWTTKFGSQIGSTAAPFWTPGLVEPPSWIKDDLDDFQTFLVAGVMLNSFSVFESGVRRTWRKASGSAERPFPVVFKSLLSAVTQAGWAGDEQDARRLVDLLWPIRNTQHNNARFYPVKGGDQNVEWRDSTYEFRIGESPSFMDWGFNERVLAELMRLNESLMRSSWVASLDPIE